MKNKKRKREIKKTRRNRNILVIWAIIALTLVIGVFFLPEQKPGKQTQPLAKGAKIPSYTLEKMQEIWQTNFWVVIENGLFANKYPFTEIQERFNIQMTEIRKKYGIDVKVNLSPTYLPESSDILAGCWTTNGEPRIDIIVPKIIDILDEYRRKGDKKSLQRAQNELVMSMLHELDHLAFDLIAGLEVRKPLNELVDSEVKAWALTCEHTIRLFIEKNMDVTDSTHTYYNMWIAVGRDEKSPIWRDFIFSEYRHTRE